MATRTISGTLDTLEHEGTEITYKGSTDACDRSENIRGFLVNPGDTGDIIVYNISFEKRVLKSLIELYPKYENKLNNIINRDL